jgi:chitinase
MTDIGAIIGEGSFSEAKGINDSGQVTGGASGGAATGNAWIYNASVITYLGTLGRTGSEGAAINNRGEVTGNAVTLNGWGHAFLYSNGKMIDIGTLGTGSSSRGTAINESGEVTGTSDVETKPPGLLGTAHNAHHAFRFSNGALLDLGTLGGTNSDGLGINPAGDIVGSSEVGLDLVAMLYSDGKMYDLNKLAESGLDGARLIAARGINRKGQIVADGCLASMCQAYRLDPVQSGGGGGACAFVAAIPSAPIDPTLPAALLATLVFLLARRSKPFRPDAG